MRFLFDSAVMRVLARVPLSCPYPLWGLSVNWAGVLARCVRASEKDQGKGECSSPYRDRAQGSRDGCFAASQTARLYFAGPSRRSALILFSKTSLSTIPACDSEIFPLRSMSKVIGSEGSPPYRWARSWLAITTG